MEWLEKKEAPAPVLSSLDLYPLWFSALVKGSLLQVQELKEIRTFCWQALYLVSRWPEFFNDFTQNKKNHRKDCLFEFSEIPSLEEALEQIDSLITEDGSIRKNASDLLKKLYEEKQHLVQETHRSLDKQVKQFSMEPLLQDKYVTTREGRWVLPIKSGKQHEFKGTVHASSDSKRTVFMEPETVILLNNRLCSVEQEMKVEVRRLLKQITTCLRGLREDFALAHEQLLQIDIYFAQSKLAMELNAGSFSFSFDRDKPEEGEGNEESEGGGSGGKGEGRGDGEGEGEKSEGGIYLYRLRNPLLQLNGVEPVTSSLELSDKKPLVLISGPNAGGKTVLLKSIGLAVLMSRFGMPICASPSSRLPFFAHIHTVIGDLQSMNESLSTFSGHLKALNRALSLKGKNCLLLIDEICGVTDPEEGMALAKAFMECYVQRGVWTFVSSHFMGLKSPWKKGLPIQYGSMPYDIEKQKPSYQFVSNALESSFAFHLAKSMGVENSILKQAYHYLSPEAQWNQKNVLELRQTKSSLIQAEKQLQEQIKKTEAKQKDYENKLLEIEEEKQKKLEEFMLEKENHINSLLSQLEMEKKAEASQHLSKMKENLPKILKFYPQKATQKHSTSEKIKTFAEFQNRFPSGSKVFIPRIGQEGVLQEYIKSKDNVVVLSQSIRMSLHWSELQEAVSSSFTPREKGFKVSIQISSEKGESGKMDLRGLSGEQALEKLEKELDRALVRGELRLQVIHGGELLKKVIRSYLSRSVYVKKWQSGLAYGGADGVTWVDLSSS